MMKVQGRMCPSSTQIPCYTQNWHIRRVRNLRGSGKVSGKILRITVLRLGGGKGWGEDFKNGLWRVELKHKKFILVQRQC